MANRRDDEVWAPPGVNLTQPEAIRVIGIQLQDVSRAVAHVASEIERHEHWHDKRKDDELTAALNSRGIFRVMVINCLCAFVGLVVAVLALVVRTHG